MLSVTTPLGKDKLSITELTIEDAVSDGFVMNATLYSADQSIRYNDIIGRSVTVWLRNRRPRPEPINGIVRKFAAGVVDARGLREYRAEIIPWFWLLKCTADCRIFQNSTFPQIIEEVFRGYGFVDYEMRFIRRYEAIDYCVQYRESAYAFLSRWMEKLGIFYFFRHEADRHVMVIGDNNFAFKYCSERDVTTVDGIGGGVTKWQHSESFRPGRRSQSDFAFKTPALNLLTQESTLNDLPRTRDFEVFDHPGGYTSLSYGRFLTRTRMEEEESRIHLVEGDSDYATFRAGGKITMNHGAIETEESQDYVLTSVTHHCRDVTGHSDTAERPSYANRFDAVPVKPPYRPARRTPWPVVHGPQTAIVVGVKGELIHTEKHGRVKLKFHWDRRGKSDDSSSCWVRVSQNTAGAGWGGVFIPHVGHEVIVSFLEGDPDRPMVTGRVYNGENQKAIALPSDKTQSAIRDHSGNEIVMEGKKGVEDIRINATKDTNVVVHHDYNETVKTGNRTITIASGTHTETIKGNTTIRITNGNLVHRVEAGIVNYFASGNVTENYNDHHTSNVFSDVIVNSLYSKIFHNAALAIQWTTGASQVTLEKDGTITVVGKNIRIVGSESVRISGDQVEITGNTQTKIGVGGQNTVYSKEKVATSGAAISSAATGEHDISGAVVKIN